MRFLGSLAVVLLLAAAALPAQDSGVVVPTANTYEWRKNSALELYRANKFVEAAPLLGALAAENADDAEVHEAHAMALAGSAAGEKDLEVRKKLRAQARAIAARLNGKGIKSDLLKVLLSIPEDGSTVPFSKNPAVEEAMREGEAAFSRGDMKRAIELYTRAMLLDPNLYEAPLFIGDSYYKSKLYGSAGEWFARAIQTDKNRETAYRYWGDVLLVQDRDDEALEKYLQGILADPYERRTWMGLSNYARKKGLKLQGMRIQSPNSVERKDDKNINITLMLPDEKKDDGMGAWMMYDISRSARMIPRDDGKPHDRHGLAEEAADLRLVLDAIDKKVIKKKRLHPSLALLQKIEQEGLLEAYILLQAPDQEIAKDYRAYRDANRDKLVRFIREYLMVKQ